MRSHIIFYGGLHLEGKLVEIFEKMKDRKTTVGLGDLLPKKELLQKSTQGPTPGLNLFLMP